MRSLILMCVFGVGVLALGPYLTTAFAWWIGDQVTETIERDGSVLGMISGPNTPQPDWMPKEPGASIAYAHRWQPSKYMKDGGGMDVVTRKPVAEVKAFYAQFLRAKGLTVEDPGYGPLNAGTAAALSLEGFLIAEDATRNLEVVIQIGSAEASLFGPARLVKINWRELWPGQPSGLAPYRLRKAP